MEPRPEHGELAPLARREFKEALRAAFVAGTLGPSGAEARQDSARVARGRSRRRVALGAGLMAAAAGVLLFLRTPSGGSGGPEPWRVWSLGPGADARVGGEAILTGDLAAIARAFERGEPIETGAAPIDARRGSLRIRLGAGAALTPDAELAAEPGGVALVLERGELWLTTDPGRSGEIRVRTPDVEVVVLGTALSVLAFDGGTCVCVERGVAQVTRCGVQGECRSVSGQHTCLVLRSASEPLVVESFEALTKARPELESHHATLHAFAAEPR